MVQMEAQIDEKTNAKLSYVGRKYFKFIEFDKDEVLITEIRKHPIGLFFIYLTGLSIVLLFALMLYVVGFSAGFSSAFDGAGISGDSARGVIALLGFVLIVGAVIVMTIQAILYVNNVIFVTSEKIAQVLYLTLFNRKISQLSIGDVQDVTVTQKGILAHIFNYGTLVIETAGEQQNYTFTYIPDPYTYSRAIVSSHEVNLTKFGN